MQSIKVKTLADKLEELEEEKRKLKEEIHKRGLEVIPIWL